MRDRIKILLEEKNLNRAEFADLIGVGRPNITQLMTGRNKTSQIVVSRTLLTFPEINPMWLINGEGEMYKSNYNVKNTSPKKTEKSMQTELFQINDNEAVNESSIYKIPSSQSDIKTKLEHDAGILKPKSEEKFNSDLLVKQNVVMNNLPAENHKITTISEKKKVKEIKKVVFFYDDRTFEEYYPSGE